MLKYKKIVLNRIIIMQQFSPVSSNRLYIQIYNQLFNSIVSGAFSLGEKLPSEKELCTTFNVSRVPIREALCALELNGMIETVQGGGAYIKSTAPLGISPSLDNIEPQDIIRVRMTVEPDIARLAAENIGNTQKIELREILERFRIDNEKGMYATEADSAFHLCIAKACQNNIYLAIMEMVLNAMRQDMWEFILRRTVATPKYREANYQEHRYIGEAILGGRADDAYIYMKEHMEMLYERYWG